MSAATKQEKNFRMPLTVAEAARIAGLSERRILQFCNEKRFRCKKVHSHCWLIDPASYYEFLEYERPPGNPGFRS